MSNINPKLVVPAVAGAAIVLAGGYFGLSSYASGQAEKELRDFLYEHKLESAVSWKSLSSSPFGGTITLNQVEVELNMLFPVELKADRIVVSDFKETDSHKKVRAAFDNVQPIDSSHDFADFLNRQLFGDLLTTSGQTKLDPQNLKIDYDFNSEKRTATLGLTLDTPNLFTVSTQLQLDNVRSEASLGFLTRIHPALAFLPGPPTGFFGMAHPELDNLLASQLVSMEFSYRDQGYMKRASALQQRYMAIHEISENPEPARKKAFAEQSRSNLEQCMRDVRPLLANADKACKAITGTATAQEKGFQVSAKPSSQVRLADLGRLDLSTDDHDLKRLVDRLNMKFSTL